MRERRERQIAWQAQQEVGISVVAGDQVGERIQDPVGEGFVRLEFG